MKRDLDPSILIFGLLIIGLFAIVNNQKKDNEK
jgi:hypothetical protein